MNCFKTGLIAMAFLSVPAFCEDPTEIVADSAVTADQKRSQEVELAATKATTLLKDALALIASQEAEVMKQDESPERERQINAIALLRKSTLDAAAAAKAIDKTIEKQPTVVVAAMNLCGGGELGLFPSRIGTLGGQASVCVTLAHRVHPEDLSASVPTVALTGFAGGQAEWKNAGGGEPQIGVTFFVIDNAKSKKITLKDLDGWYGGVVGEIASASNNKVMANLFTGVGAIHGRVMGFEGIAFSGPAGYEYLPVPKFDAYLVNPFTTRVLSDQTSPVNLQGEAVYFKMLWEAL